MSSVTHLAGIDINVGDRVIQRCSICGAMMLDSKGAMAPVGPNGEPTTFPVWERGRLIEYSGEFPERQLMLPDTDKLPDNSCLYLVVDWESDP